MLKTKKTTELNLFIDIDMVSSLIKLTTDYIYLTMFSRLNSTLIIF